MPRRKTVFYPWVAYHIYNRWVNKRTIFLSTSDYEKFCEIMVRYFTLFPGVHLLAFCLLPNHFHFLLSYVGDDASVEPTDILSLFMWRLQQAYATYLVRRYTDVFRKWPIFEWRFKSKPITDEWYLTKIQAYINLNAVKHGIVENIKDWPWTSVHDILDVHIQQQILLTKIRFPHDISPIDDKDL